MIPNLYKIAGELTSTVFHVAARTFATQASVDLWRPLGRHGSAATGLGACSASRESVQEAMDLAMIAHAATLEARVPFIHFFDGFRTSHEVMKVERADRRRSAMR